MSALVNEDVKNAKEIVASYRRINTRMFAVQIDVSNEAAMSISGKKCCIVEIFAPGLCHIHS